MTRPAVRRPLALAVALALIATLAATPAVAHPDVAVVDGTVVLGPGETVEYPMALHFHRLVGRYRLVDGSAADLSVAVVAQEPSSSWSVSDATPLVGGGAVGRIDRLIDCCLGTEYAPFGLVLRNEGNAPARLDLRAWAVHDDLAVVAHAAEGGAVEFPAMIVTALLAAMAVATARARRAALTPAGPDPRTTAGARAARSALRWSVGSFLAASAAAATLGAFGMARYGSGPVTGLVAILADVPLPGGPFGSRAASVMGVLLLTWVIAIVFWTRAVRWADHARSTATAAWGATYALAAIVVGGGMTIAYGASVPLALGLLFGLPTLGAVALLWDTARRARGREAAAGGAEAAV